MMRKDIIEKTADFVKTELSKLADTDEVNRRSADYRYEHSVRVAHIGKTIANKEGFDEERMFVACLLHDIGYSVKYESVEEHINHGRIGARIAKEFLKSLDVYTENEIEQMCYGIAIHVDDKSDFEGERTPFALTVGDADNIDRFDAYRLYENLHFANYANLPIEQQYEFVSSKIRKLEKLLSAECGTKTASDMWKEKIGYQADFYLKLRSQIENSKI